MCGIFAIIGGQKVPIADARRRAVMLSHRYVVWLCLLATYRLPHQRFLFVCRQGHRGPDWSGVRVDENGPAILCHERLSIVDVENGAQPLVNADETVWLSVNGEIYNRTCLYCTLPVSPLCRSCPEEEA